MMPHGNGRDIEQAVKRMRWWRVQVLLLAAGAGCGDSPTDIDDLDLDEFDALPVLENLDYGAVTTAEEYDYWVFRRAFEGSVGTPIAAVGSRESLPPEVQDELDATVTEEGFGPGCPPGTCHQYIASVSGTSVRVWASVQDLVEFLGEVDTPEDAALLVHAHGYYWAGEKESGAVRAVTGGYELIALRLVNLCAPVQVDRYLLRVNLSGDLSIQATEVWSRSEACI